MSFNNFLEHALLDLVFGQTAFTPSGTLYVGVSTTTPTDAGTNFTEPSSASGYARAAVTNNKTNWSAAAQNGTSGQIINNTAITFGISSGNWGTITDFGIFDHPTAGNMYGKGTLTNAQTININNTLSFPSGQVAVRMD